MSRTFDASPAVVDFRQKRDEILGRPCTVERGDYLSFTFASRIASTAECHGDDELLSVTRALAPEYDAAMRVHHAEHQAQWRFWQLQQEEIEQRRPSHAT